MIPEPYVYVRAITITLGMIWTIRGLMRLARLGHRWSAQLEEFGLDHRWLRRQVLIVSLRSTLLDPVNLGLFIALMGPRGWLG